MFESTLSSAQNEVCSHLKKCGFNENDLPNIQAIFEKFATQFRKIKTEKQRFSQLSITIHLLYQKITKSVSKQNSRQRLPKADVKIFRL